MHRASLVNDVGNDWQLNNLVLSEFNYLIMFEVEPVGLFICRDHFKKQSKDCQAHEKQRATFQVLTILLTCISLTFLNCSLHTLESLRI